MRKLGLLVLLLGGCALTPKTAIVDGRIVPRQTLEFDGQAFTIKHDGAHPQPGGPSSGLKDAGGSIRGRVCGMMVDLDVTHKGDHVQLVGSLDNHIPAAIDVRDENGGRHFTGNLGGLGVDFVLNDSQIEGHVGIRVFILETVNDVFVGFMRIPGLLDINGSKGRLSARIRGKTALQSMPAADQAAVLPALFTCNGGQYSVQSAFDVGFGGRETDLPPETSAVYTHGH